MAYNGPGNYIIANKHKIKNGHTSPTILPKKSSFGFSYFLLNTMNKHLRSECAVIQIPEGYKTRKCTCADLLA